MTSGDERNDYIWQLRAEGWMAPEIAAETGLSRSQVYRILAVVGDPAREEPEDGDEGDEDDWEGPQCVLDGDEADEDEVYPPPPPWTFVGYDGDEERWITDHGKPVDALARYRWRMYQIHDHDDRETVKRVKADMDRQRGEYAARFGERL